MLTFFLVFFAHFYILFVFLPSNRVKPWVPWERGDTPLSAGGHTFTKREEENWKSRDLSSYKKKYWAG